MPSQPFVYIRRTPNIVCVILATLQYICPKHMVGRVGIGPTTPSLKGWRSTTELTTQILTYLPNDAPDL